MRPVRSRWWKLLPVGVALGLLVLVIGASATPTLTSPTRIAPLVELTDPVRNQVAQLFEQQWADAKVLPAGLADELQVLRRLSLALHGTIPSVEEQRAFDADTAPHRLDRWTTKLLQDRRFSDYFSYRLARFLVGADDGQFLTFRRDRFNTWVSTQLQEGAPFDQMVREMISAKGLWTGVPATNFITAAANGDTLDPNELAGTTSRAFLGQRIDCAQCHNHPWKPEWQQSHFAGLAACFSQVKISVVGIEDDGRRTFDLEDRETLKKSTVQPAVPFGAEWYPAAGTARERLAGWVTDPRNRRFERAIANRMWGLLFGTPWIDPVDDLPDPAGSAPDPHDLLDVLGADFREHNYDLRRLITVITSSPPFRLASTHPAIDTGTDAEAVAVEESWAVFPLVRLRPEQVIGGVLQAGSLQTIDQNSHLLTRVLRFFREIDFVRAYGDLGADELGEHQGTIPQALLRMNGKLSQDVLAGTPMTATGRLAMLAPTDAACLDLIYRLCLSRAPLPEEVAHFLPQLRDTRGDDRMNAAGDIAWTLFNSPEFSWNH